MTTCSTCSHDLLPDNRTGRCAECKLIDANRVDGGPVTMGTGIPEPELLALIDATRPFPS